MHKIDVYDFDGTIYNGDSSIDFFLFCIFRRKKLLKYLPINFIFLILYLFHIISVKKFKEKFFSFIKEVDDLDYLVNSFWNLKKSKINNFFLENIDNSCNSVYVISASPEFLLLPYLSKYKNIKLIGTIIDKNGNLVGENCSGNEKILRLNKSLRKYEIENFYTDSIKDLPLVEKSKKSFYVENGKVSAWDDDYVNKKSINKKAYFIFVLFFTLYCMLGVFLSFHYDFSQNYDLMFDSDTSRVISDMSNIGIEHYRIIVHPLFVLLIQPFIMLINGITQNNILSIIIFSSFISSLSVSFIYKFSSLYMHNNKLRLILTAIFGFSFSMFVFTAGIELYNIAMLFLILIWYYTSIILNNSKKVDRHDFVILLILGILNASITVTNFIVFLISLFILIISKKINIKKSILLCLIAALLIIFLSFFQNVIWHNTPTLHKNFLVSSSEEQSYVNKNLSLKQFSNMFNQDYSYSIISSNLNYDDVTGMITFQNQKVYITLLIIAFYGIVSFYIVKNFKNNKFINIGLLLTLLYNSLFHLFYGNNTCFLYSCHFIYIPFLLLFVNYDSKNNNILINSFFIIFLAFELIINLISFKKILFYVSSILNSNYFRSNFSFVSLLIISFLIIIFELLCLVLIIKFIKKATKSCNFEYIICVLSLLILLMCPFITLRSTEIYNKLLIWRVGNSSLNRINIGYKDSDLYNKYKNHYISLNKYVSQYKKFVSKYDASYVDDLGDANYYFFGFANRRKFVYIDGKLIDISTKSVYKSWDVDKYKIIPNDYCVILKDKNGNYIKIIENNKGVYIIENNKKMMISGTRENIDLYDFKNQKFSEVKKVLYSEILFNIKDNTPYPNILVYDSPFYRDAAMVAMVLKQTNNVDLIEKWIDSINNVYDMQNSNQCEPDNLGELLYIMSLSKNNHKKFINKILQEANNNASNNKNGFYLNGNTDYQEHPSYQNYWFKFGVESLNLETKINYSGAKDSYSALAWWSKEHGLGDYVGSSGTKDYPYLSWAQFHSIKKGSVFVNSNLYPLSWEKNASEPNYENMSFISSYLADNKISPTHTWTASEMLLLLLDDTHDLKELY